MGELEAAFELGSRGRDNRRVLDDLLAETFVDLLDTTASVARHYGRVFSTLKRSGTPLPVNDIWLAAATIDCGGTLPTVDRDFERVPGMGLIMLAAQDA